MNLPSPLKAGLVVFVSAIGTIVASDLILRSFGYLPQVDHGWLLGENVKSRVPDNKTILVRPQFLTDQYYAGDPTRETVVTLGDSFVEGHPVAARDSYPAVLSRLLGASGRPVNVINMGLGDSGPDQHLRLFKEHLLPRLTPAIVAWSFYSNDISDNLQQAVYDIEDESLVPVDAAKHWLHIRHNIYRSIPLPTTIKESSPVLRLLFRAQELWGKRGIELQDPNARALSREKIRLAIEEMERLAQTLGFRVYYVLIAPQAAYLRKLGPQVSEQDALFWSQEYQVSEYEQLRPIVARQPQFIDAWFGDPELQFCGSRFEPRPWSSLFADDGRDHNPLGSRHFNEAGYHLLAEIVAACLSDDEAERPPDEWQ